MGQIKSRNTGFMTIFGPPLVVIAVIAMGLFFYYRVYGASSSRYDNAMSNCVRDRTFWNNSSREREEATVSCSREIPGGQ